jgi:response regulator RpfG family c-di-GMP phosphodiesterase
MTAPQRPRILLVDDEALLRHALRRLLRSEFDVFEAQDGATALEVLAGPEEFSVIVSDYDMPGMDGHALLQECARRFPATSRIMLTGRGDLGLARRAIEETSIHRFLCKPCDASELTEAIRSGVAANLALRDREREFLTLSCSNQSLDTQNHDLEERVRHQAQSILVLRRLGIEMNRADDLGEIARAAAECCFKALDGRGVRVQVFDSEGSLAECSLGPEMSNRMISEPLMTTDGHIGEVTLDVLDPDGRELTFTDQNTLAAIASMTAVAAHNETRRRERDEAQYATVVALARLSEQRDQETGQHLERVSEYCRLIAESLVRRGCHIDVLTPRYILDLERSAPLHDIGKVGIPDSILLKRGKLSASEWEIMKSHSEIGAETLRSVARSQHTQSYLAMGLDIALCHHEKWDGSGYPAGLVAQAIPLAARILALADVYDALTTVRPYKHAWSHAQALALIEESRGSHFDPDVVDAFVERALDAAKIRARLADDPLGPERSSSSLAETG